MNKKILSLVLALVMVLGTFTSVFAAETKTDEKKAAETPKAGEKVEKIVGKDNKIQYVIDKKFVEGYEDGSYGYDKHIKRSEITRLLVIANGNEALAKQLQGSMKIYSDVDAKHWANGVITVGTTRPSDANGIAMLAGYPDGTFQPEKDVTYAELAKMLVVLVKKDLTADMVKNAIWSSSWMTWAAELGILDDVTVADANAAATRADAFVMLYNALYKMQEFKRVPANEKIGVLSSLNNAKLVLNQDKEQEYTITTDTVFVNTYKANVSNIIKVKDITNPNYYLGSLVRIMVNDKKEVTHILELGNPKDMALGLPAGTAGTNTRWAGVADKTVSTGFTNIPSLKYEGIRDYNGFVTVNFKANDTKVKSLSFTLNGTQPTTVNVAVNSDTKVYVANPYNNIMKEVKDINEALSLIGFKDYKDGYRIPNVYAGYNTTDVKTVYGAIDVDGEKGTATHVVFNVVSKEAKAELYRVVNSSSSLGNATLENTDGKLFDRDFFKNLSAFPYNYGDLYDVIKVRGYANAATDFVSTVIDHSDVVKFPIVKVVAFDKNTIQIEDVYGDRSVLDVRDADIFNAKQYKDLRVGDRLQFTVDNNKTNVANVVSLLPADVKLAGAIKDVLPMSQANQYVGTVAKVYPATTDGLYNRVTIDAYRDIYNGDARTTRLTVVVDRDVADLLKEGTVYSFKVSDRAHEGERYAYDFVVNRTQKPVEKPVVDKDYEALKAALDAVQNYKDNYSVANRKAADEAIAKVKDATHRDQLSKDVVAYVGLVQDAQTKADEASKAPVTTADEIKAAKEKLAEAEKAAEKLSGNTKARMDKVNNETKDKIARAEIAAK